MLNLIGTFYPDKIDWIGLKTDLTNLVKRFCVAWVTPMEWDDKVIPPIIGNAVDRLVARLNTVQIDNNGGPIRFGAIKDLEANGPPVFGMLPAEHSRAAVYAAIEKAGGTATDFPDLIISVLQLIVDNKELFDAIKFLLGLLKK